MDTVVWWLPWGVTLAACGCWLFTLKAGRRASRHTSLTTAWNWLLWTEAAVIFLCATDILGHQWPGQTADYGWCVTSILLLCPPMAVLGARRPGVQVWTVFILLPMVLVLSWPVWTVLLQGSEWRGLELESPTVIGFGLVLLMSGGNFLGTRFAFAALLWMLGTLVLFLSCTGWKVLPESIQPAGRLCGVGWLEFAFVLTFWFRNSPSHRHPVNRLWDDFRNAFGIVWGLRMVERINALAVQEQWTIRMSYAGFPENDAGRLVADEARVVAACRWLFRRFVDEEWVDARLGQEATTAASGRDLAAGDRPT